MSAADVLLRRAGWAAAAQKPIASDASDRTYIRLRRGDGATAILMRAPVATSDTARRQFAAFRRIADWLRAQGFSAPDEIAADADEGLLLLEDLGETRLAQLVEARADDARLAYAAAGAVLADLAAASPPPGLDVPSPEAMAGMTEITFEDMPGTGDLARAVRSALVDALDRIAAKGVVSLRDMHGDNLIWRPEMAGKARIGLLDFQDALILPDGYDIASLVDDPRRVVPEEWRSDLVADYAAARGMDGAEMAFRVDLLSVMRNVRVLGIFRRLAERRSPAYARFLPRTRALLVRAAARHELSALRPAVAELVVRSEGLPETAR